MEHIFPDGSSHPDGLDWGSGAAGSREAGPAKPGLHSFVLRCAGSAEPCDATANLQVTSVRVERTRGFGGSAGTEWVHVVTRAAGSTSVSVRTVKMRDAHNPPFDSKVTSGIDPGETKTARFTGTLSGGDAFTTTVTYELVDEELTISHSSATNGSPSGSTQQHGVVSLAYNPSAAYKRSLQYDGNGASVWLHIATRKADQQSVDVRTIRYNPNLAPAVYDDKTFGISPGACETDSFSGTVASGGDSFTTEVEYCRSSSNLTIGQRARIGSGSFGDWQRHGTIPIE